MKKTVLLLLGAVAMSSLASATIVSCTITASGPLQPYNTGTAPYTNTAFTITNGNSGGTISNSINCPTIDAGAGNIITSFSVLATGDYTGGPIGTTSGTQVDMVFSTLATTPIGASSMLLAVMGGNSSTNTTPTTPFQLGSTISPGTQILAGFNVAVSSTVVSGSVGDSSGQVVVSYTTATAAPEPATLAMTGSVLFGLGVLGLRKKTKK